MLGFVPVGVFIDLSSKVVETDLVARGRFEHDALAHHRATYVIDCRVIILGACIKPVPCLVGPLSSH